MTKERYRLRFSMKADGDEAEVMIYSDIDSDKWFGDETTPKDFDAALKDAKKAGAGKLNIRINSPGGDVYSAVAMRSMVINAGFDEVRVMIEGLCASAATLFATVPGAKVVIAQGSEFMVHNPYTLALGSAEDLEKTADHLHKLEGQFHALYAQKTGQDAETVKGWMDAETWFTAEEAVEAGFCDELLESEPVAARVSRREMAVLRGLYGRVPDTIAVLEEEAEKETAEETEEEKEENDVRTGNACADSPEIETQQEEENTPMDTNEKTLEQMLQENPDVLAKMQQDAVAAERQRMEDIDALTLPGYEALADKAKKEGLSALDFQKQVVSAQKEKAADFLAARKQETQAAKNVGGGDVSDTAREETDVNALARDIADYAKSYLGVSDGTMY